MKNVWMILAIIIGVSNRGFAQNKLPDIVPPSPQSRSFQVYGEYPVNYNTGIPDISIPLYTIKSGELEVPMTLRYYASGIKPYDPDLSNIGAGWTLDVGGLVSRTVEGRADELFRKQTPFLSAFQVDQNNYDHILYLNKIVLLRENDAQYDKFSYSFLGKSGSFGIEDNGSGDFAAYSYPFVPYKINVNTTAPTGPQYYRSISGIDITDDKGIIYQFGHSNIEKAIVDADAAPTGWYLEKVSNASNTDEVTFEYETVPLFRWTAGNSIMEVKSNNSAGDNGVPILNPCSIDPINGYGNCTLTSSAIDYETKNIKKILFKEGYIQFNLSTNKKVIESIAVYNSNNEILRTISFSRDNFPGSSTFQRLKSISTTGKTLTDPELYEFTYNETYSITDNNCLTDQWGYCRGSATNTKPCVSRTVQIIDHSSGNPTPPATSNISVGTDNYTPNEGYMKRYILEKIKYPSGGVTNFEYEAKQYLDGTIAKTGGGLRIKKIVSFDNITDSIIKSYEYDPGFIEHSLSDPLNFTSCKFTILSQCLGVDLFTPMYYVFRNRTLVNGWHGHLGSNNVYYKKITEYFGLPSNNTGKKVFTYSYSNHDELSVTAIGAGKKGIYVPSNYIKKYRGWGNGLLAKKEIFKNNGSSNYVLMEDENYTYQFSDIKTLNGLYVFQLASYAGYFDSPLGVYTARNDWSASGIYNKSDFLLGSSVNDQSLVTGAYYLTSLIQNKYDGPSVSTTTTSYEYDNLNHYYPTKIITSLSSGEKQIKLLSYVDELSTISPYSSMKLLNIIAPVIETKEYFRNISNVDRLIRTEKNNYSNWSTDLFKLSSLQYSVLTNAVETRISFNNYDNKGNLLEVQKSNDAKQSYIWDYNSVYPIAQVVNSAVADIAHTSFEADGKGGWIFSGTPAADATAPTGKKAYTLGSSITKSGLSTTATYIVSYWKKSGTVAVNGTTPISGKTINGWTYHEHTVTNPVGGLITVSGTSGVIDELRLYPAKAQMTTYTYEPLIGMTGQCDANNRITYYEYDGFGRLKTIRDQDKNVIKTLDYQYQKPNNQ